MRLKGRHIILPGAAIMQLWMICGVMSVAATSCQTRADRDPIIPKEAYEDLRPGDIVFRRGTGVVSQIVTTADIDGKYSHVGIVAATDSGLVVVHAVPDEPDFPGDVDRVKAERPEAFFSTFRAQCGAVGRPFDAEVAYRASLSALQVYEQHTLFDHDFNDADTTQLYCCELITLAFEREGECVTPTGLHHMHLPGVIDTNCTLPSDIYNSKCIEIIYIF